MRQICEIRKLTGGRYLVVLEDDFQFPLYGKELDHYDIREAGVLREAAETEILQELFPKRAKLCAMHFLQNSDRTEEQVRRKLRTLFYPEDIKLPITLILCSDFFYGLTCYVILFLLRAKFDFSYYLVHIILPEMVYTVVVTLFLYPVILRVNHSLEQQEKRGEKKFV